VVYCAFEGQDGYGKRAEAFRQRHLAEDAAPVPFYLVAARMSLVKDYAALIASIRAQLPADTKPVAVVLDTLNRSLEGSESDDKDMSAYVRAADAIREAFGCAVIIVHHCGVEGTRPRGHTSLTGAVDAQIAVKRDAAGNIVATVEWMKDGPEGDTVVSRLDPIEVGTDADGEPITSCVVVAAEGAAPRSTPPRKLSNRDRLAFDALVNCAADYGKPTPPSLGLPQGLRAVEIDQWRQEIYARGILDRDAGNPRQEFKRLKESLQVKAMIGMRDELVWSANGTTP
jgi:AAA domain